jgi:hypothetical protein
MQCDTPGNPERSAWQQQLKWRFGCHSMSVVCIRTAKQTQLRILFVLCCHALLCPV